MEDIFISIVGTPAHISKLHTNNGIENLLEKAVVGMQKSLVLWRTNNNGGYLHFNCWYASAHFKAAYQQWHRIIVSLSKHTLFEKEVYVIELIGKGVHENSFREYYQLLYFES